jgi:Ca2+:H+ antiporter
MKSVSVKRKQSNLHFMDGLLIFVPLTIALYYLNVPSLITFLSSAIAVAGLSHVIVEATGIIAQRASNTVSALINATFGNAIEFMIAIFSLRQGLVELVKASIIGSIMINVLLLIGLSMLVGGLKYKEQKFNKDSAGVSSTMLIIVVVGLVLPSMFQLVEGRSVPAMSISVSIVLGIVYILSLIYTLITHKHLFIVEREVSVKPQQHRWPFTTAMVALLISIGLASFVSDILVKTINPVISSAHLTEQFVGLVIVALLTNIPEHISAVIFARKNNMTLSLEIGMSSALQIALFVVPILVILSTAVTGTTLDLVFGPFALASLVITAMIANYISSDGVCHWLEGAELTAVYVLIAIAFYFI